MDMENNEKQESKTDNSSDSNLDSLDSQSTQVVDDSSASLDATDQSSSGDSKKDEKKSKKKRFNPIKGIAGRLNIYLLLFVFILLVAGIVTFISYQRNKDASNKAEEVTTTPLSDEDLENLRQTDVKVGDPKQVLSVESNAIFAGKVLVRDSLEVAGQIKVGGPLNLPGISVSGSTVLDEVEVNNLQIAGNATVQGQFNVQADTAVSGNLTVGGTLSAANLSVEEFQINGDLQLNRHIDAGGGTPGRSTGTAIGSGGTVSISGTDTAGTVNINTGGGTVAGCFATINFTQSFSAPHISITPVGSAAASINYYVNRSSSNFSICTTTPAPVGQSFAFDYIVID